MEIFSGYYSSPSSEVSPMAEVAVLHIAVAGSPFPFNSSNNLFTNEDSWKYNSRTQRDEVNENNIDNERNMYFTNIEAFDYIDTDSGYYILDNLENIFFKYVVMPSGGRFV